MKQSELEAILSGITPGLFKHIKQSIAAENAALQHRIHVLEQKCMRYCGVWQRAQSAYARGDAVTFQGVMWYCCVDTTTSTPGTNADWQMTAKSTP